jgi:hypothetical protein
MPSQGHTSRLTYHGVYFGTTSRHRPQLKKPGHVELFRQSAIRLLAVFLFCDTIEHARTSFSWPLTQYQNPS